MATTDRLNFATFLVISTLTGPEQYLMMHFVFKREPSVISIEHLHTEEPNLGTHSHLC